MRLPRIAPLRPRRGLLATALCLAVCGALAGLNAFDGGSRTAAAAGTLDDAPLPWVEPGPSAVVAEGDTGTTQALLTVKIYPAGEKPFTVNYSTADGDAGAPGDYVPTSGQLTFAPGETVKTVSVTVNGDTEPEQQESFVLRLNWPTDDGRGANAWTTGIIFDDDDAPGIHFAAANYDVAEGAGHVDVRVVRRGDASASAAVNYRMFAISASAVGDYTSVGGRFEFAPGETEKSFAFLVNDDAFVEEPETVGVVIEADGDPLPAWFESARVTILSDDSAPPTPSNNSVDDTDNFVRQHYHDFLNREPDPGGFAFWTGQLEACGADAECLRVTRAGVSAAFFLSIEFQRTGYLVYRVHAATYPESLNGDLNGRVYQIAPLGVLFPNSQAIRRGVFVGQAGWEQKLRDNTLDFARRWVESAEFKSHQPADMPAAAYVDRLFANAGAAPAPGEREAALAAFGAGGTEGRAAALLSVADSGSVYNRQYNPAYVAMQYYGYLRRSPRDAPDNGFGGYDFWLAKLDSFSLPGEDVRDDAVAAARTARAEMARAFVESGEYRARFGTP